MNRQSTSSWLTAVLLFLSLVLLVAVQPYAAGYGHFRRTIFAELLMRWKDPTWQHGALVPFITGFLLCRRRNEIAQLSAGSSHWGFLLIVLALLL